MNAENYQAITEKYPRLRIAVVGDFCLDRYLEIDPAKEEKSLETGLPVHNVVKVRSQPGAAGTVVNNLAALGIGEICPVGFAGQDGEGYELVRELKKKPGINLEHFVQTAERRTFTYCKPLVMRPGKPPEELNRLDSKNWTPTPPALQTQLVDSFQFLAAQVDGIVVLDQVDKPETGVLGKRLLEALRELAKHEPDLPIVADSRRGLRGYPPVIFKMNAAEFGMLVGAEEVLSPEEIQETAATMAKSRGREIVVTLSEQGILGAGRDGAIEQVPARPARGPIDPVGAGDAVTANLAAAFAAGASLREALEIANAAASVAIHQLGTTGIARVDEILNQLA